MTVLRILTVKATIKSIVTDYAVTISRLLCRVSRTPTVIVIRIPTSTDSPLNTYSDNIWNTTYDNP